MFDASVCTQPVNQEVMVYTFQKATMTPWYSKLGHPSIQMTSVLSMSTESLTVCGTLLVA